MAKLVLNILTISFFAFSSNDVNLNTARSLLFNEDYGKKRTDFINTTSVTVPVLMAYKGVFTAMEARTASNVYKKYKVFSTGRDLIEKAVEKDKQNFEIRFLRLLLQSQIPALLGYNNMSTDKVFILNNLDRFILSETDRNFKLNVLNTLKNVDVFSNSEKARFGDLAKNMSN